MKTYSAMTAFIARLLSDVPVDILETTISDIFRHTTEDFDGFDMESEFQVQIAQSLAAKLMQAERNIQVARKKAAAAKPQIVDGLGDPV